MSLKSEFSVQKNYDGGNKSLKWIPKNDSTSIFPLDWSLILDRKDKITYVRTLPPQILYHSLKTMDKDTLAEVMPLISNEQLVRIIDYDAWSLDSLDPKKAFFWLSKFNPIEDLALRYKSLDEEYQIALLQKYIEIFDKEQFEALDSATQDNCIPFSDNELYYLIKTDDPDIFNFIRTLISSAMNIDINYAFGLLAYAYYNVPNEPETLIKQFRQARLEEDGFVSYEESQEVFLTSSNLVKQLEQKWNKRFLDSNSNDSKQDNNKDKDNAILKYTSHNSSYIQEIIKYSISNNLWERLDAVHLQLKILYLSNCLCTISQIDPSDVKECVRLFDQLKSICSLGLEFISQDNMEHASIILKEENLKNLFRTGLYLLYLVQDSVILKLEDIGVDSKKIQYIKEHKNNQKWGLILDYLDKEFITEPGFDLVSIEVLKAIFNRFPMKVLENTENDNSSLVFTPISSLMELKEAQLYLKNILDKVKKDRNNQEKL